MYNRCWEVGRKNSNEKGNKGGGGGKERRDRKKIGKNGNKAFVYKEGKKSQGTMVLIKNLVIPNVMLKVDLMGEDVWQSLEPNCVPRTTRATYILKYILNDIFPEDLGCRD